MPRVKSSTKAGQYRLTRRPPAMTDEERDRIQRLITSVTEDKSAKWILADDPKWTKETLLYRYRRLPEVIRLRHLATYFREYRTFDSEVTKGLAELVPLVAPGQTDEEILGGMHFGTDKIGVRDKARVVACLEFVRKYYWQENAEQLETISGKEDLDNQGENESQGTIDWTADGVHGSAMEPSTFNPAIEGEEQVLWDEIDYSVVEYHGYGGAATGEPSMDDDGIWENAGVTGAYSSFLNMPYNYMA